MPGAVLFDFYGTLARWCDVERTSYAAVLAGFGYSLPPGELEAYFARYDGIEHVEHSTDGPTYEAWVRRRLGDLTSACGVAAHHHHEVVDALRASDQAEMVAYEDAAPTLRSLRAAGVPIGVCSNWGWELTPYLDQVGLLPLVDVAVTSARAGARKPHPRVYAAALSALGVEARRTVFVGDTWGADVIGPRAAGMTAVHLWRPDDRSGDVPPELDDGVPRIADLNELLDLLDAPKIS
jgi:putative hydrolase of the HAD superfamily